MAFMTVRFRAIAVLPVMMCAVAACSRDSTPPAQQRQSAIASAADTAGFENRVWRVNRSSTVEVGQLYVFLSDGTLLIASAHGTPAMGKWRLEGGRMTMIEEGIPYEVTILQSSPDSLSIRMANPGEPVDIDFVPASASAAAPRR